jgi:uracil-DNA glycosylase
MFDLSKLDEGWRKVFDTLYAELDLIELHLTTRDEAKNFYPLQHELFRAFELTPLNTVRVIIIGESPFPRVSDDLPQACGLAFSGRPDHVIPASTNNVLKEVARQYPNGNYSSGSLENWARQGVLLLNSQLTYHPDIKNNKKDVRFWSGFTKMVMQAVSNHNPNVIILAWGGYAATAVGNTKATILFCGHPSPQNFENDFMNNGHFLAVNEIFEKLQQPLINWSTAPPLPPNFRPYITTYVEPVEVALPKIWEFARMVHLHGYGENKG